MELANNCESHEEHQSVDSSFLDSLWPLILDDNQCRVESESVDFFVPRKRFDQLHWHKLLAKAGYPDYEKPLELRCCEGAKQQEADEKEVEQVVDDAIMDQKVAAQIDYELKGSQAIRPIDKEVDYQRGRQERRQKLAYDFANRKYPWTMQTPSHELEFVLTKQLRAAFACPMERDIIEGINRYGCKLMLIDGSSEICVDDFKRWLKFRPYVQILAMVRCPRVERQLQLLRAFNTLLVEEDAMNTWHDELQSSLRKGIKEAKTLELYKNCADSFVFIFSRYRGLCTCDTFKFLRHV